MTITPPLPSTAGLTAAILRAVSWAAALLAIVSSFCGIFSSYSLRADLTWVEETESKSLPYLTRLPPPDEQNDLSLEFAECHAYVSRVKDSLFFEALFRPIETFQDVVAAKKLVAELCAHIQQLRAAAITFNKQRQRLKQRV